jgi:hypothetical protein
MDVFLRDLMKGFDLDPTALDQVYLRPNSDGSGHQLLSKNPNHKPLAHLTVDFYREQLYPGPRLTELGEITCKFIDQHVRWNDMHDPRYIVQDGLRYKDLSLLHWCEDILLRAAARSIFGDALLELNPNLIDDYLSFDTVSWKLMYRYPRFLSPDMHKGKDALVDAVNRYFELPREQRTDASWFIEMQEAEMKALGISVLDISKFIALIYWVVNTNAYKLLFWMLSFLLHDADLVAKVTTELQDSFRSDGSLDVASLQNQTPYLTALWHEALRCCNSSASARFVTEDVDLGEYTLKAGRRLLIPYRQLHLNTAVFGANAASFDITRFLKDKKLAQNPSYRPFGGGATYCPGRFLAKQEIFMALAFLLYRFDVELPLTATGGRQKFPRMDELKPGIGILGPVDGDDLTIRVSPKKVRL